MKLLLSRVVELVVEPLIEHLYEHGLAHAVRWFVEYVPSTPAGRTGFTVVMVVTYLWL
jgi:hypothetical protein